MSKEAVLEFFQTLNNDEALTQRLTAIEDPAEVARIAESELGYSFTPEELTSAVAAIEKVGTDASSELSDEQLEAVAGGLFEGWTVNGQSVDFNVGGGSSTDNLSINISGW